MDDATSGPLEETRPPSDEDLARLAHALNELDAKYIVIGSLAIIAAGYTRTTCIAAGKRAGKPLFQGDGSGLDVLWVSAPRPPPEGTSWPEI